MHGCVHGCVRIEFTCNALTQNRTQWKEKEGKKESTIEKERRNRERAKERGEDTIRERRLPIWKNWWITFILVTLYFLISFSIVSWTNLILVFGSIEP